MSVAMSVAETHDNVESCGISNRFESLINLFTTHPYAANQGYFEHLLHSLSFAFKSGLACVTFILHGIFPFTLEFSGSAQIDLLNKELQEKRQSIKVTEESN